MFQLSIGFSYIESHVVHDNKKKKKFISEEHFVGFFVFISITTLPVDALFNKLLRCLILRFREISKPWDWHSSTIASKFDRQISSTTAGWHVQFQSDRSIFDINFTASILQDTWGQLSPNRYHTAGRNKKWLQDPFLRTRREHPHPSRLRPAVMEVHNMKTL